MKKQFVLLVGLSLILASCAKKTAAVIKKDVPVATAPATVATTKSDDKAVSILKGYIDAIGGKEKLMAVKSMMTKMTATTAMGDLAITQYMKDGKSMMKTEMGGSVVMEQIFDGTTLQVSGMGVKQNMTDEKSIAGARKQARPFDELDQLLSDKSIKKFLGTEDLNGVKVNKVSTLDPDKNETTQYFDVTSNLLLRTISTTDAMGQKATQTIDMSDYKDVSGVKFPHSIKLTGGSVPFPLDMKIAAMMINSDLPDQLFKIN